MNKRYATNKFFEILFLSAALLSVLVLLGIFGMLLYNGISTFKEVDLSSFLIGTEWNPSAYGKASYGILSMIVSTLMVTAGAMLIAIPLGIGTAAFLSEVAPTRVKEILKPAIEMLAAVPSVAIGFVGIVLIGPFLSKVFDLPNGLNALNGAILLAFMSLPTIVTIAEDAIRAVPKEYKEASFSLGANKWVTLVRVTLPGCASGLLAAVMLGMGRAIGETMTVLMATGNATAMPEGFFSSIRTMTATIAIELGEVPYGTTHYFSLFAIGLILFLLTLTFNLIAERVAVRFRRKGV